MSTNFKRILVPIDFSPNARAAKTLADDLAAKYGAEVKLLHVVESPSYEVYLQSGMVRSVPVQEPLGEAVPSYLSKVVFNDLIGAAQKELERVATEHKPPYKTAVRHGYVVDQLLQEIDEYKPDLVVMSTHGWTGVKHLMLGSVAEKLVRLSPVPVLTTKSKAA